MRIKLSDFTIAYEDTGRGLPLLLIHGFPFNHRMWHPQIEALSGSARVIAPDLRGHGESTPVPGPYSMDQLAGDLAELLDTLNVKQPIVLCGLSMGGYISFAFYRRFPGRVAGLILAATRAKPDTQEGKANRDKTAEKTRKEGVRSVADSMIEKLFAPQTLRQNPDLVEQVRTMMAGTSEEGMIGALMGMKERPDSTPTLEEIQPPALIIHGRDDQIVPLEEAEAMQSTMRDAKLVVVPDAGHLVNMEQPEAFNHAVRRYLEQFRV